MIVTVVMSSVFLLMQKLLTLLSLMQRSPRKPRKVGFTAKTHQIATESKQAKPPKSGLGPIPDSSGFYILSWADLVCKKSQTSEFHIV